MVLINLCQALYTINSSNNLVPVLATAMPTITNGGKTYTIHVRSGIKFNDGTPFNAAAVQYTLERDIHDSLSVQAAYLTAVKSVSVVNPTTVQIQLTQPYAPLTALLADRAGMIGSPAQLKKLGNKFGTDPVCVAPFAFSSEPSDDQIILKKSSDYYGASHVHIGTLIYQVITQPSILATDLQAGSIQVANDLIPSVLSSLKTDSSLHLMESTSLGYNGIAINIDNTHGAGTPPFTTADNPLAKYPALREAFNLALNRETINKVLFDGDYVPGCGAISPASPYFPNVPCPAQNVAEAKKLVKSTGLPLPIPITLITEAGDQEQVEEGTVLQQMLGAVGFKLTLQPLEANTGATDAEDGKFELYLGQWSGRVDPEQNIQVFWEPSSRINYSGIDDTALDNVLAQARSITNVSQRRALYAQATKLMLSNLGYITLYYSKWIIGVRSDVTGVQLYSDGLPRMENASLTSGS
ncbi:MAG TPA: ABC transporter substrate-binding protein [Streptosporangiaceae bacterium]|nr:ABC transporter substrate-binding protein [Streptosporangiaceae bacterium]